MGSAELEPLIGKVDHFLHLAAIYDLNAKAGIQQQVNAEGTRQALQLAERLQARCFHHCSSIAVAGLFDGLFREDMFDEAEHLDMPYFQTKHEAEGIVRKESTLPWRIYRPGIVVGDANTGEMDKVDGPYYFFKTIQKLRRMLPPWMPAIGVEGGASTWCRSTSWWMPSITSPTWKGRQQGVPPDRFPSHAGRRHAEHLLPRRPCP